MGRPSSRKAPSSWDTAKATSSRSGATDGEGNTITIAASRPPPPRNQRTTLSSPMGTGDGNAIVLDTDGNILGVAVEWNLVYEDNAWNSYLFEEGGQDHHKSQ